MHTPSSNHSPLGAMRVPSLWLTLFFALTLPWGHAAEGERGYEIWENEQAPNRGGDWSKTVSRGTPYDGDWEYWSYPIGNGYMGASVFGRTDTERVQITEKTIHNEKPYGWGGLTGFAEIYLDFNHQQVTSYRRFLSLNEAIAKVEYESGGIRYQREYFVSYPDNVMVIRLTADRKGTLSLVVRPEIAYLGRGDRRSGTVKAEGDLLTLAGTMPFFSTNFEAQIKVLNEGGTLTADADKGVIAVKDADTVVLIFAAGTNYELSDKIFSTKIPAEKCDPNKFPHKEISARIAAAQGLGFGALKQRHLQDYQNLFGRVAMQLNSEASPDPTSVLLQKYKQGDLNVWLEELMFHYGRYLLIASSREKTLPAGLQGVWSQYYITPWSGGYWHNINVQMNYWGAMSANLAETFEAYIAYFKAYLPEAREHALSYVSKNSPDKLIPGEDNGWIIGTGANAYHVEGPGGHSGPGTGGFTSKLLMEYYLFTQDSTYLKEVAYPAMRSMSTFYSKALVPQDGLLLIKPSASPEQRHKGEYYVTVGCTFDQAFVWENHHDTLVLAQALGEEDDFIRKIRDEMTRLDPIQIGASGQIKEYREEVNYSDIGDPKHRHISHLCALYPGTLINLQNEAWMRAASKTLDLRGDKTTGWAMAHRMNARARLKEAEKAHAVYRQFIQERAAPNLWTLHPPFQIDGNFGAMAGVVEMLLQSHTDTIEILPALPPAWPTGSFRGLVARGNFVVNAEWREGKAVSLAITSRAGGECRLQYSGLEAAEISDDTGKAIETRKGEGNRVAFDTIRGSTYRVSWK
jgi:alpha-L-fucosidase 2